MQAKHLTLYTEGLDIILNYSSNSNENYYLELNIDQVVLLLKQSAEIISRCSIVRPIP